MMSCLSVASPIHSSLSDHHSSPPSLPRVGIDPNPSPPKNNRTNRNLPRRRKQAKKQQQPTVIQLERAIGTGVFSGVDSEETEPRRSVLDGILPIAFGKYESAVEKKLREMGEWIISRTETGSPSAGKNVLLGMFVWILPTWILLLLVASGTIKLPFSTPFIDDLLM